MALNIIVREFVINQYTILTLDGEMPKKCYSKYVIDGKEYAIVPLYDMPNCIAIEAGGGFVGKTVEFY
jgi:hypothetical protein